MTKSARSTWLVNAVIHHQAESPESVQEKHRVAHREAEGRAAKPVELDVHGVLSAEFAGGRL
jgi:hypothetical protein